MCIHVYIYIYTYVYDLVLIHSYVLHCSCTRISQPYTHVRVGFHPCVCLLLEADIHIQLLSIRIAHTFVYPVLHVCVPQPQCKHISSLNACTCVCLSFLPCTRLNPYVHASQSLFVSQNEAATTTPKVLVHKSKSSA